MNLESVLDRTRQIIRRKHYSWNTEKVYCHWIERYSRHVCKLPRELSSEQKMERFLTCLARGDCSASTQNQAFNAILFLYNEVLERPLGDVRALRARRKPRVVTAPSRNEVARIFSEVDRRMEEPGDYPLRLIVKLLYGCGLRVSEPLNLRIKDVDLENSRLTIREAKGGKDRVVPLPCSLVPALQEQMKKAQKMWMRDRQREIPAPLPGALDRKYPNAGKSWAWYWLFPAHRPCRHPRTGTVVRWRVHEVNVQKVVREAAQKCGLESYVTPHVLRHAFATHSLQQGATVRDVQEVLGHASIETTMRYLHAATDRLRSPLDTCGSKFVKEMLSSAAKSHRKGLTSVSMPFLSLSVSLAAARSDREGGFGTVRSSSGSGPEITSRGSATTDCAPETTGTGPGITSYAAATTICTAAITS